MKKLLKSEVCGSVNSARKTWSTTAAGEKKKEKKKKEKRRKRDMYTHKHAIQTLHRMVCFKNWVELQ